MADRRKEMFVMEGTVSVVSCPSVVHETHSYADELQAAWNPCFDQRCRLGIGRRGPV